MNQRDQLLIAPLSGYPEEIGIWLSALQDTRQRTLRILANIEPEWLDLVAAEGGETISTVLYHLAAIEASWLYEEILQVPFPPEIEALLPYDVRDEHGKLTSVSESLEEHLRRLNSIRRRLLHEFSNMTVDDLQKVRALPEYDVTPVYVIHHLMQHEAEHRSQIDAIRLKAKRIGNQMPEEES